MPAFIILFALLYLVPALIGFFRSHRNWAAIAALNLLLGWTILGWIGALVWSLTDNVKKRQ